MTTPACRYPAIRVLERHISSHMHHHTPRVPCCRWRAQTPNWEMCVGVEVFPAGLACPAQLAYMPCQQLSPACPVQPVLFTEQPRASDWQSLAW